ncbi:hypothetical protein HELRODRAFT_158636 [Helobdella robusta]|uniref:Uncharacterized protein n=1 Tax=Helobdella robusta TaxID=6412 RepID=T1EN21_HELRO|nr:hypothetical protein HELRODRAFT_158636 [Helobdella robusta]ESO12173.1 hypothetical protein HELRODRAFT_158636 [Helobdella robusta]
MEMKIFVAQKFVVRSIAPSREDFSKLQQRAVANFTSSTARIRTAHEQHLHRTRVKATRRSSPNHPNLIKFTPTYNPAKITPCHLPPIIYILNVTSIVKPHAIENLRCDVYHLHPDIIIIITESWLRPDHPDGLIAIDGYTPFRKDRPGISTMMGYIEELSNTALGSDSKLIIGVTSINSTIIPYFKQVYTLYSGVPPTKKSHLISPTSSFTEYRLLSTSQHHRLQ